MWKVPIRDLISDLIRECIGFPREMSDCNDFKLLYQEVNSQILVKEEKIEEMKHIVQLRDYGLGI